MLVSDAPWCGSRLHRDLPTPMRRTWLREVMIAFAESYRRGDYDREKGRLSRWLFGLAYNHLLRFRQKQGRQAAKIVSQAQGAGMLDVAQAKDSASRDWDRT